MSLCQTCGTKRNACERCLGRLEQRVADLEVKFGTKGQNVPNLTVARKPKR
jgi:hypothetical protein